MNGDVGQNEICYVGIAESVEVLQCDDTGVVFKTVEKVTCMMM